MKVKADFDVEITPAMLAKEFLKLSPQDKAYFFDDIWILIRRDALLNDEKTHLLLNSHFSPMCGHILAMDRGVETLTAIYDILCRQKKLKEEKS